MKREETTMLLRTIVKVGRGSTPVIKFSAIIANLCSTPVHEKPGCPQKFMLSLIACPLVKFTAFSMIVFTEVKRTGYIFHSVND